MNNPAQFWFYCPGCKQTHAFGSAWNFNGDYEKPTVTPSILVRSHYFDGDIKHEMRCHSFITDGKIRFLGDCTHNLAGQTVDLPDNETVS